MNPFFDSDDNTVPQYAAESSAEYDLEEGMDPLDAFMNQLDVTESTAPRKFSASADIEDDEESPEEMMDRIIRARNPKQGHDNANLDVDDENHAKRALETIPEVDHSQIKYTEFKKDFYQEHPAISAMSSTEVSELRRTMGVSVSGAQIPKCVCSFAHLTLPESILSVLRHLEFTSPTPIQSQAIPCALSGRNVLGLAMTGSGKTMSYVIPAIVHILGNEPTGLPRVAVVCPTRELAIQIEQEIYRFVKRGGDQFTSLALTGGLSKYEQFKQLAKGCDIVVGNPGRMIDLLQMKKGLDLSGVTMCVLDEADRMFKMGFENQLRAIVQRIRPHDRQLLMFSATMPPRIEKLAREIMDDPIRVVVGAIGQASSVIDQNVFVAHSDEEKQVWLKATLPTIASEGGRIMIFVNSRSSGDELVRRIKGIVPIPVAAIHGDLDQADRMRIMSEFRSGKCPLLVATDVAARGLDVQGISCVIEYDAARDFDTHTHRIGRTGRAGVSGTSWTLLGEHESKLAAHIVESIEAVGLKNVQPTLMALALKHAPFRAARVMGEPHEGSAKRDDDEVAKWEPLAKHFRKGATENLNHDEPVGERAVEDTSEAFAPGVHSAYGKLSKVDYPIIPYPDRNSDS